MEIEWSDEKNAALKDQYGFGFERVVVALSEGALLENRVHPNTEQYGHQHQLIVDVDAYAWIVCFAETERSFLKTMFPSRKATKRYLERS